MSALVCLLTATAFFRVVAEAQEHSLKGQLLVASSRIGDRRFQETVIVITEHSASGTLGLIVNKPAGKADIGELLERVAQPPPEKNAEILIHYGGPVERGYLFLLHSTEIPVKESQIIIEGLALSTDPEMLRLIAEGKGPRESLLIGGYAGWGSQQLERELAAGSWITIETDLSLVFTKTPEKTWERIMKRHRI